MELYQISKEQFIKYLDAKEKCYPKRRRDENNADDYSHIAYNRREQSVQGLIGFVHVYGTLLHDATELDRITGCTDYQDIIDDIDMLVGTGSKAIVFVFDSGGGTVRGSIEAAQAIRDCAVPTVAFIHGNASSAAYKLASSCTYIINSPSAIVGNIGTIMTYLDQSQMINSMGLQYLTFVNDGAIYKSIGHGDTSLSEEQIQYLQEKINQTGREFQNYILSVRPNLNNSVFTAAWYEGQSAVDVGLSDEVATYERATEIAESLIQII